MRQECHGFWLQEDIALRQHLDNLKKRWDEAEKRLLEEFAKTEKALEAFKELTKP